MEINTTRFGNIQIKDQDIITLEKGLIGFEKIDRFILIPSKKNTMFGWMQAIHNPNLAFVVTNPYDFYYNYEFDLENEDVAGLDIENIKDAYILVILVIPQNPDNITANLLAPIVINNKNRKGKQIILKSNKYCTKHYIMKDLKKGK